MSKIRKWLPRLLCYLLISVVIGGAGYSWNAKTVANNQLPMPFGFGLSVVMSGSMEPALHINDLVIVEPAEEYVPGDIVVYQSGSSLVIHRIVETDGTTVRTQGDANNTADEPFPIYNIKGKLVRVIPRLGAAILAIQSKAGLTVILALAVFLLIRSMRQEDQAAQAETDKLREEIEKLKAEMLEAEEKKES